MTMWPFESPLSSISSLLGELFYPVLLGQLDRVTNAIYESELKLSLEAMKMMMFNLEIPVPSPLKRANREKFTKEIISSFKDVDISDVQIADYYYRDLRSDIEPLALILVIQAIADLFTIALALNHFLKKPEGKDIMEFRLNTDSQTIVIKGEMSSKDITKILEKVNRVEKKEDT